MIAIEENNKEIGIKHMVEHQIFHNKWPTTRTEGLVEITTIRQRGSEEAEEEKDGNTNQTPNTMKRKPKKKQMKPAKAETRDGNEQESQQDHVWT